ncbi:MAG TPA: NAD(P)H-dependent oxidoreductase [Herpetosiphonaceae bacterium]|nr:NAD(P)H-dependent oxidoreductase [Herpetosiphonaceae bacterium]
MADTVKIVGISGSLRQQSFNTALLHAASELLPPAATLEIVHLGEIPGYDQDALDAGGFPAPVQRLRDTIGAADALLIASPEYNYSISGVLKNAIDWVSRPGPNKELPFDGKPLGMMGATPGLYGTVRAQTHLRQIAVYLNMFPINKPEVLVTQAGQKFSAGRLTDEATRDFVKQHVEALVAWTLRLRQKENR